MIRRLVPVLGAMFASCVSWAAAQEGTASRTTLGDPLGPSAAGVPQYAENSGWNSPNYDQERWAVEYATRLSTSPWISVLQGDRKNAVLTAAANELTLDLAGHTYTIQPYLKPDKTLAGGIVRISDRQAQGAIFTVVNGTFNNAVSSQSTTYIGESNTVGRLTVENALFKTGNARFGEPGGSRAIITLRAGGQLQVIGDLFLATSGIGSIELLGSGSQLIAQDVHIADNLGSGSIVLRDAGAQLLVSGTGFNDLSINNNSSTGLTAGLRVEAGEVRIDDELILSVAANSSGVVRIDGGTVDVGGRVVFNGTVSDTTGGKVFLSGGRLVVVGPDRLAAGPSKQFYWEDGTLAFSGSDTTLTATQLQNYTRQGAISYGGDRVAGSLAGGQVLESAGKLTLSGGTIGLAGGTIRAGTELAVNTPLTGYGTLDAVVTGTGTITNATSQTLAIGALGGATPIDSTGELRVGGRNVDATYAGTSTGAGVFAKVGTGTQTVTGKIANLGGVEVRQGTLAFEGTGPRLETTALTVSDAATARLTNGATGSATSALIGSSSTASSPARLELAGTGTSLTVSGGLTNHGWVELNGATLTANGGLVNHGRLVNNGILEAVVSGTGIISGSGSFSDLVAVAEGGILAPGNSPGQTTFSDLTLGPGGLLELELAAATGTAGLDWDLVVVTDVLSLTATATNPFLIALSSLTPSFAAGTLDGFDPRQAYSWKFLSASIAEPASVDLASFRLQTDGFSNWNTLDGGTLSIAAANDGLYLDFAPQVAAVPEPGSGLLLALAGSAAGVTAWRRRRRNRSHFAERDLRGE